MLALYAGVAFMSELRVFYTTKIEVTMFGHPVGVIWIAQKPWMVPATETISNQTAHTSTNNLDILSGRSAIEAVPDQGRYTNPAVPRMAMDYTLSRRKVNSEDILTCIMEGLLIIAYDGPGPFSYLNAVSASGAVAMNLHAIITPGGHQRPGPEQFAMSTFLFFLSTFYSVSKRWDDMDFVVLLHDPDRGGTTTPVARAEGFVLKI
ncbi:MAG: hypothetical protein L6R39_007275 [Caloplaca ligustica]|nr:MAG: hypothetical protein L6R39_007275 [Caloplaca ligustica]